MKKLAQTIRPMVDTIVATVVLFVGALMVSLPVHGTNIPLEKLPILGLLPAVATGLLMFLRARYIAALAQRAGRADSVTWEVHQNDVKVGAITDRDYAAICLKAVRDPRLYVVQLLNGGAVVLTYLGLIGVLLPALAFWGIIVQGTFFPVEFLKSLADIHAAGPVAISSVGAMARALVESLVYLLLALCILLGFRFGFENKFSAAIMKATRERCGVATQGEISLYRWENGEIISSDEAEYFRIELRIGAK